MRGHIKIPIIALAFASLFASGCGATDITGSDARVVEAAISDVDTFCDVVDGKTSVSLNAYDKLVGNASISVKKLISVYKKDPTGTFSSGEDKDKNSQTVSELLRQIGDRLSTCDPAQANKIRKAISRTT